MKTAIEQMYDFLCKELKAAQALSDYPHIENAILKCEELREVEQKQLAQAFDDGEWNGCPAYTAEDHYKKTYK